MGSAMRESAKSAESSRDLESLLDSITTFCNPMVARWKMRRLHQLLSEQLGLKTVVEVGTGHAALTVLVADALIQSEPSRVIYTFDRIAGGSREAFGTFEENTQIIRDNLCRFGIEEAVHPIFGDVASTHGVVDKDRQIDLLVLDADGRIDRDLMIFWRRMAPGCLIVLDDAAGPLVAGNLGLMPQVLRRFSVDGKNYITSRIEQRLVEDGFLRPVASFGDLHVLRKQAPSADLTADYFLDIYRSVIPAPATFAGSRPVIVLPSPRGLVLLMVRRTRLGRWAYSRFRGRV